MEKDDLSKLRKMAEKEFENYKPDNSLSEGDKEELIHELQVQKIELEMQNEELKTTKEQLEQSRDHFSLLYHNSPEGIITLNKSGIILESNNTISSMLDLDKKDFINKSFSAFINPEKSSAFMSRYNAFFKSPVNKSIEVELIGKKKIQAQLSAVRMPTCSSLKENECLLVNITNITERKRIEKRVQDSEKTLRDIFESLLAGFWDWNLIEETEYLSPTFKKMFGYEDHELENKPETWQNLIFQEELPEVFDTFNKHVESHGEIPFYNEVRYHHKNGSTVWVLCAGKVIEWSSEGKPVRMVGCHIDITRRKQIEELARKQLDEKEILLKEVHHRIKNNITSIETLLSMQLLSIENIEAASIIQDAVAQIKSMRILYEKLLVSKGYSEVSTKEYTESLIDAIIEVYPNSKDVVLDKQIVDFNLDTKSIIAFGIIINELLTNVFKYAYENNENNHLSIVLDRDDNHVTLIIQDNGVGINERKKDEKLNKSTGFGLEIVEMLARQLDGTFTIEDNNGTRSVLEFNI